MRSRGIIASGLFMSLLGGCLGAPGTQPADPGVQLHGTIDLAALFPRKTQASVGQIADASTVSLMETAGATATTIATTVTKPGGSFSLALPRFTPDPAKTYVLEAVKGLYGNAVNKDAARIRTLLKYRGGAWLSPNNLVAASINLGVGSTAICIMYGLQAGGATIDPNDLMGSLSVGSPEPAPLPATQDTYAPPGALVAVMSKQDFHTVSDLVYRAIQGDSDPISAVQYNPVDGYFVKTSQDPFIDNLSSVAAGFGAPLVITGYRFEANPANNTVYFGGATGSVAVIDPTQPNTTNTLYVTVPEGAPSGLVMVRNATGLSNGIQFTVLPRIGGKLN